jgi:hypothetical protein
MKYEIPKEVIWKIRAVHQIALFNTYFTILYRSDKVANRGVGVRSCGNAVFLNPSNNRTIMLRHIIIAVFSQVFPGTFLLEPMVNPATQASSF